MVNIKTQKRKKTHNKSFLHDRTRDLFLVLQCSSQDQSFWVMKRFQCGRRTQCSTKGNMMNESPYTRFDKNDLILRDELAIDRTLLANERTLLAYLRSGMALLIAGVSIIHFSQENWFWVVGIGCIPTGIIISIIGVVRYWRMNKSISLFRRQSEIETKKIIKDVEPIHSR